MKGKRMKYGLAILAVLTVLCGFAEGETNATAPALAPQPYYGKVEIGRASCRERVSLCV